MTNEVKLETPPFIITDPFKEYREKFLADLNGAAYMEVIEYCKETDIDFHGEEAKRLVNLGQWIVQGCLHTIDDGYYVVPIPKEGEYHHMAGGLAEAYGALYLDINT